MKNESQTTHEQLPLNWKKTILICGLIALVALGALKLIRSTEPSPQRVDSSQQTAMLVDVITVERGEYRPNIRVMGLVRPVEDVMLSPRVSGEIIARASHFNPGGYVKKGEMLLKIDPSDYANAVARSKSQLHRAEADLKIEMGRQTGARLDYELLDRKIASESESLILRQPQLEAAQADIDAAQAMLNQDEMNMDRTTIRAPFDAQILSREVAIGSQVAPKDALGRLVGLEHYWVTATVPIKQLQYIDFADGTRQGSRARIRNRTAWDPEVTRAGRVDRLIAALDQQTRLVRVNINVQDPLATHVGNAHLPLLIIGSLLEVTIEGKLIKEIIRLPRDYVREEDTVWIFTAGHLAIQAVTVEFRDAEYAYISSGLEDQDQVVTSGLSAVVNGSPLRLNLNAK